MKSGKVEVELDPGIMECFDGHKGEGSEYCETTVNEFGPGDLAVLGLRPQDHKRRITQLLSLPLVGKFLLITSTADLTLTVEQ